MGNFLNFAALSGSGVGIGLAASTAGIMIGGAGMLAGSLMKEYGPRQVGKIIFVASQIFTAIAALSGLYFQSVGLGMLGGAVGGPVGFAIGTTLGLGLALSGTAFIIYQLVSNIIEMQIAKDTLDSRR